MKFYHTVKINEHKRGYKEGLHVFFKLSDDYTVQSLC